MWVRFFLAVAAPACVFAAQALCPPTPAYSPCELTFELSSDELEAHPNPYRDLELEVEFRSPRFRTFSLAGFWDGDNRMVVRFAPTEAGPWDFRVLSNVASLSGRTGRIEATASDAPGFLRPRNTFHWGYTATDQPHLWMGDTVLRFGFLSQEDFTRLIAARARQKFNHIRGYVLGGAREMEAAFPSAAKPDPDYFRRLDGRIQAMNKQGIIADLVLAAGPSTLLDRFTDRRDRERLVRFLVARYAAFNITWQIFEEFESHPRGRELVAEIGHLLAKLDPYDHPRTTGAAVTAGSAAGDGWMSYLIHNSASDELGAIERQLYAVPIVNVGFTGERQAGAESGTDNFRRRLWNATMNGAYPTVAEGRLGTQKLDSAEVAQMSVWYEFFAGTRFWELRPYFDVDGGRALALEIPREDENPEGIEYIVYVEKPGPVEIVLQRHSYDVAWIDPATGRRVKQRDFRGDRLRLEPPDKLHDWVLHISRESRKQSLLRSYKFETHSILLQEIEQNPQRIPFEIEAPAGEVLPVDQPVRFAARLTRASRATRAMQWLWTGEVSAEGRGYRVLAVGQSGEMRIPADIAGRLPAVLNLRLLGMNANGKVYALDRVFRLEK